MDGGSRRPCERNRGAAALEFVLILPMLTALLFGVIEFGAAWSQRTDVQHGAREAARLAAVNYNPLNEAGTTQTETIFETACGRMGDSEGATIELNFEVSGAINAGDVVIVRVVQPFEQITGIVPISATLASEIDLRLERPATWAATTSPIAC